LTFKLVFANFATVQRTRLSAEERKLAIVMAALPLFARKGFAETTTKDLARAAGVSEPLLYRHFANKEALYLEIQRVVCKEANPVVKRLMESKPSTATMVHLVYFLMRALIMGVPRGVIGWETRHRLMVKSFLEDGVFARTLYHSRFDSFCARVEECLEAAILAKDAVKGPVTRGNRIRFAHHIGAWLALAQLPATTVIDYRASREELLDQATWFALRGMGLTDKAIATYYKPKELARSLAIS